MTDFFPAGRTRYPGRNAEEKTILLCECMHEMYHMEKDICLHEMSREI